MQADRPLLTYGLSDGDVLDIVPWEPAVRSVRSAIPAAVSAGTTIELHQPVLSSPTHALYISWQKAADGLRSGAPRAFHAPHHRTPASLASCERDLVCGCANSLLRHPVERLEQHLPSLCSSKPGPLVFQDMHWLSRYIRAQSAHLWT